MTGSRNADGLDPASRALWRKVTDTVSPLHPERKKTTAATPTVEPPKPRPPGRVPAAKVPPPIPASKRPPPPGETLDGGWDRRLRRGIVLPDRTIDLHGHTLATAHAALDHAIDRALADDVRVLLVVTGKPPREGAAQRRGAIRAAIGDWLHFSRHAPRIAAIRNAHPRHGGQGALYLILRRRRET